MCARHENSVSSSWRSLNAAGVSAVQFAQRAGLKYSTLAGWLQRYRRSKPVGRAQPVRMLEAVVDPAQGGPPPSSLTLHLPGGAQMEVGNGAQAALAAELVRALAQGPCGRPPC